jgi:hypothetical protein
LLFGQFAGGADERGLLVFGVFLEHAPIILNFCRFEEGWLPFLQWSHEWYRIPDRPQQYVAYGEFNTKANFEN